MNTEVLRAKLAGVLVAADEPMLLLDHAVQVLAAELRRAVTICDANELTVLASTREDALGDLDVSAVFAGGTPVTALNVGTLTVVLNPEIDDATDGLRGILELVAAAYDRASDHARLRASERRLSMAQELAGLGSYDWDIHRDVNVWSDELYRIYGTEPQSFHASYERFLGFIHPDDRDRIRAVHQHAYETGEPYAMEERIVRPDGSERILSSNGIVIRDASGTPVRMTGICWDVTDLKAAERAQRRLEDTERARRQSLEINDTIVQGLALASHELDGGHLEAAAALIDRTLSEARRMASELLEAASDHGRDLDVLTRSIPCPDAFEADSATAAAATDASPPAGLTRVLVADDTEGMRALIRAFLSPDEGFVVVGEAVTGRQAIALAQEIRPDLVVLDLSMPEMDGLQAIPELRASVPGTAILVVSGYGGPMVQRALDAGAHAFVEKGPGFEDLVERARDVTRAAAN